MDLPKDWAPTPRSRQERGDKSKERSPKAAGADKKQKSSDRKLHKESHGNRPSSRAAARHEWKHRRGHRHRSHRRHDKKHASGGKIEKKTAPRHEDGARDRRDSRPRSKKADRRSSKRRADGAKERAPAKKKDDREPEVAMPAARDAASSSSYASGSESS